MTTSYTPQPLVWDNDVIRFRQNKIVRYLLDAGPFDLSDLGLMPFDREDREQFAQLIGYSAGGFGELDYTTDEVASKIVKLAAAMIDKRDTEHPAATA